MGLIVVDASVIVDLLAADDVHRRTAARQHLTSGDAVFAPAYLDIEIVSAMRGLARRSDVLAADAPALMALALRMPIRREPLARATADRIWQLRENMTAYDAGYVALAEQLSASLLTCDRKYTTVPGLRCAVEFLS
jgi:predicted nucleic acid-binding protein